MWIVYMEQFELPDWIVSFIANGFDTFGESIWFLCLFYGRLQP